MYLGTTTRTGILICATAIAKAARGRKNHLRAVAFVHHAGIFQLDRLSIFVH